MAVPRGGEDSRGPCSCCRGGADGVVGDDDAVAARTDHDGNAAVEGVRVHHRDNRRVEIHHHRPGEDSPAAARGTDRRSPCPGANGAVVVATTVDCTNERSDTIDAAVDCVNENDHDRADPAEAVKVSRKDCGRDDGCCVRASESGLGLGLDRSQEEERVVRDRHWWCRRET